MATTIFVCVKVIFAESIVGITGYVTYAKYISAPPPEPV